jgi:hypothetical protein
MMAPSCFDVLGLVAALGEETAAHRFAMDDLEEEGAGALLALGDLVPEVADGGERAADEPKRRSWNHGFNGWARIAQTLGIRRHTPRR